MLDPSPLDPELEVEGSVLPPQDDLRVDSAKDRVVSCLHEMLR